MPRDMIIRSLARPSSALHSLILAPARCSSAPVARHIHTLPTLADQQNLNSHGIPGLLSKRGFDMAWTEYMEHVLEQLNGITAGTELENKTPQSLTIEFARDPLKAPGFNFASMAFNNHFFFQGINTDPHTQSAPSSLLTAKINDQFSSLDTLRAEFWTTAEAMFGPGFVWLVQVNQDLRILPTYIAGSPLSAAHYRRQSQDLNTHNADSYKDLNKVGQFGAAAKTAPRASKPLGGVDITPLLCVNTWEHVWLHDYGVKGKGEYLNRWWDKINWTKVEEKATLSQPSQNYGFERFTR